MNARHRTEVLSNPARRALLLQSSLAAGLWTLGLAPSKAQVPAPSATVEPGFGIWLRFDAQGGLTVLSYVAELGQGTHSAVQLMAAEELDLPLARVRVEQAPVEARYFSKRLKDYASFGSLGTPLSWREIGGLCASARAMLVQAAATRWGVAAADCRTGADNGEGQVLHPDGRQRLPYAVLLAEAALLTPPKDAPRKPASARRLVGKEGAQRIDLPAKVNGSARFGIDARRPGMLYATLIHAPRFGAELLGVDERPAKAIPGVRGIVRLPGALAVVADSYWTARQALQALKPRWSAGPHAATDSEALRAELLAATARGEGKPFDQRDEPRIDAAAVTQAMSQSARVLDISYDVPFLAHATMEPMNALAEVGPEGAALWLSTQSAGDTQRGVAKALGLQPEQVQINAMLIGGGFGRRLEHGFAVQAALIAKQMKGRPVQLIWSREIDMQAGGYRPAAAARVRLALDGKGWPQALRVDAANPSLLEYSGLTNGEPSKDFDWSVGMGWTRHDYEVGPMQLGWTRVDAGVPCGYWRSVGASQNTFFYECSIERAAALAGIDPLAYRLRLLEKKPHTQALLRALAERAGWGQVLPPGHFQGLGLSCGNAARSAHIVQVSVRSPGRFRIERITAAVDVGLVINPDSVRAQLMGGTIFGLSAAVAGEITLKDGMVQQTNFDSYPLLTLAQTPPINLVVLGSGEAPRGVGEEGPASIGPALANALFAAAGKDPIRAITRLPLTRAGWVLEG
ncbi:molybdopterin cofactor-binding domain-containing protein [Paucibacter sp. AS339]|uniref:xanthine dehydrogenase family protein molybdopterin-binding subunit n=1 Tax=Paucibacter hankyongi TaxID=3133434 RepID=UPI0030AE62F8